MTVGVIDAVDIHPCWSCGIDALHIVDPVTRDVKQLVPHPLPGADVHTGWRFDGKRWVVHLACITPTGQAFLTHPCEAQQPEKGTTVVEGTEDPFDMHDKRPSVSFKDAPVGAVVTCTVISEPKLVQSRDFETGQPAFWPDGNKKLSAVIDVTVNGDDYSVWAAKPSALFTAIATAQRNAGAAIAPGGTLTIRYAGDKPNDNPRLNAQKLYEAQYAPPSVFAAPAATSTPAATPAAVPASPPWA